MRECKKCKIVKFDFQFLPVYHLGWAVGRCWLCKKCGKRIGDEALYKAVEKEPYR